MKKVINFLLQITKSIEIIKAMYYNACVKERNMCVHPVSALNFKAGKIELNYLQKRDLPNYDSIKQLAHLSFCDFLIEKKTNFKTMPDYEIIKVLARRKWINPNYVFSSEIVVVPKNISIEEMSQKVFEISSKAANITREKILECAKAFIR